MELSTDLLRTFVAAADLESYSAAAAVVHRTQSAISLQMKRLEESVGRKLFKRNGHAMQLTAEGQTLLLYARRMLKLQDEALAAMTLLELSGRVRLGAPEDYTERLLPIVLARFAAAYPHVQVDVACDSGNKLQQALDAGELDLIVRFNGEVAERGETIFYEQVVWVTSSRHLIHEQDPVPLAVYYEDCVFREWAIKSLNGTGRDYRIAYTSPSTAGILAAVRGGLAVAPVACSTVSNGLRILGPEDGFPLLPAAVITLITTPGPTSPVVQSLASHVTNSFRDLSLSFESGQDVIP